MEILAYNTLPIPLDYFKSFMRNMDNWFTPPLSNNINISDYSEKIYTHASFIISKKSNDIIGFLAYYNNERTRQLYIPLIAIEPSFQGHGLGGLMLEKLVDENNDFHSIALEVRKNNYLAKRFYEKHGFVETEDRGEIILMAKAF